MSSVMGVMLPRIRAINDCEDFGQTTHKFRSNHPMFSVKPPISLQKHT